MDREMLSAHFFLFTTEGDKPHKRELKVTGTQGSKGRGKLHLWYDDASVL